MDYEDIMDNILVLVDEDGQEYEFEVQAELEIEGETYRVLIPLDEEEDAEDDEDDEIEVIILKVVYDEDGNEYMAEIEDEEEWEMVADAWDELLDSEGL